MRRIPTQETEMERIIPERIDEIRPILPKAYTQKKSTTCIHMRTYSNAYALVIGTLMNFGMAQTDLRSHSDQ